MKKLFFAFLILTPLLLLAACGWQTAQTEPELPGYTLETLRREELPPLSFPAPPMTDSSAASGEPDSGADETEPGAEPPSGEAPAPSETEAPPSPGEAESPCVAIDPGHQRRANSDREPLGPGASETKAKVSSGTEGRWTKIPEYELNLAVSLLLRQELEQRGYRVVMTRTTHDVDVSNVERAQLAAEANADVLVRIHANGSEDASVHGALTICMTEHSPYCPALYPESRRLSDEILSAMTAATGAKNRGVWETDTMTGINWASMPVTIVEMGYMSNEREDRLMATEEYRQQLARGIAEGIDRYFGRAEGASAPQGPGQSAPQADAAGLQAILDDFLLDRRESWDVRVESLSSNVTAAAAVNPPEGQGFVSASIIKLFVAGALCEEIEAGRLDHAELIGDLTRMLQRSDNNAANRLIRTLGGGDAEAGFARVTDFAKSIGCPDTRLNRLMKDDGGKENYTTARDCAVLLRMLYEGRCVSPARSAELLTIMKGQTDHSRIDALLPEGTPVADKTGSIYRKCIGDVGVVFSPKGDYILCMICNGYQNADAAKDSMAALSLEVYNWFQK